MKRSIGGIVLVMMLVWHLWAGVSALWTGLRELGVNMGFFHSLPTTPLEDLQMTLSYQFGLEHGGGMAAIGAARLGAALLCLIALGLALSGARRRLIGGVLMPSVALHGLAAIGSAALSVLYWQMHDDLFLTRWMEWGVEPWAWVAYRFPGELLGITLSFVGVAVGSVAASFLCKATPADE